MCLARCILLTGLLAAPAEATANFQTFAVRTIVTRPDAAAAYRQCLQRDEFPNWQRLRRRGQLAEARVFEKTGERNALQGPDWSVLTIFRAKGWLMARALVAPTRCERLSGVVVVRAELLEATPRSDHPAPAGRIRRPDVKFLIEFIPVHETPEALAEYRETMRTSIGPAMGRLVREDGHYSSLFLETTRVLGSKVGNFAWNQIHLRGFYPESGPTHPAMTAYMEAANPLRGGFAAVFKRLDAIRSKPRDDEAREIIELQVM